MPLLDPMMLRSIRAYSEETTNEVDYDEPTDGSHDLPEVIIGRAVEASFLLHDLLGNSGSNSNQFKALGIAGTAGSGKTTICQKMFNSQQVQKHFLPRIWVCMTRTPGDDADPKITVTKRLLICLGEDEEIVEEKRKIDGISGLVSLLHRQLVGKRYLIVLDGACDADKWFNLGSDYSIQHKPDIGKNITWVHSTDWSQSLAFGLPKGYGGAVIVNGRSDKEVEMMVGKENLHRLLPLTDKDCWAIFRNATGAKAIFKNATGAKDHPQVEELRRFVVQRAGGHPLTAKLMGQCYRDMQPLIEDTAQPAADNSNVSTVDESAPQLVDSGNVSSIAVSSMAQVAEVTAVDSGSNSSIAQVIEPEAAEVPALQPVDSGNGSSMEEFIGPDVAEVTPPQSVDRGVKKNWQNRTQRLRSLRLKFPLGLSRSKRTSI